MEKQKTLYALLAAMEKAAENGDKKEVVTINRESSAQYADFFKDAPYAEGSLKMNFDRAQNSCVMAVADLGFDEDEKAEAEKERKDYLGTAKKLLARIRDEIGA